MNKWEQKAKEVEPNLVMTTRMDGEGRLIHVVSFSNGSSIVSSRAKPGRVWKAAFLKLDRKARMREATRRMER